MLYLKMSFRHIYCTTIVLILMAACVTPYIPNITKYENLLVVDGQITNLKGPYIVKLMRTAIVTGGKVAVGATGDQNENQVTGAQINIIDNTGLEILLKEISNGVYSTVDTLFRGVSGKSYKIQIKVNNEVYESDFETLKEPIPIDRIYWEYKPVDIDGPKRIQLLLDTHDPANNTRYYGWDFNETWKFRVPIDVVSNPEWKICYQNASNFLKVGTTINRYNDIIEKYSLQTINESTNRLFIRYSLLARQYSFTEKTYKYFEGLIKSNLNQGTLFDPTPYSLYSNIKCLSDKNIPVVGYFMVAGASEKRVFIDRSELPTAFNPTDGFNDCSTYVFLAPPSVTDFSKIHEVDSLMKKGYTIYEKLKLGTSGTQISLAKPICFDCTQLGDNKVPAFWTEKK
jgi:hypothetical protein